MSELQYPTVEHVQKVTQLQDKGMIEAFIETLKWLDFKAPKKFDGLPGEFRFDIREIAREDPLSKIVKSDDGEETHCGTVCCIGGAALMYEAGGNLDARDDEGLSRYTEADNELDKLFYPETSGSTGPISAARALRHYLFTGKVSWNQKKGRTYAI